MWCEIIDNDCEDASKDPVNIQPAPVKEYEARIVIWKTKDIENMDVEGCSDIYCRSFFDSNNDLKTDTHWRCSNGAGSFNYRLKLKINSSMENPTLTVQAWDKDIIASDDLIGSCELNLSPMFEDIKVTGR